MICSQVRSSPLISQSQPRLRLLQLLFKRGGCGCGGRELSTSTSTNARFLFFLHQPRHQYQQQRYQQRQRLQRQWNQNQQQIRCITQSHVVLSGHNKWSKIKQKKGAADVKKSNAYAKAARDIIVAIKTGGSEDPAKNATLANVLKAAKAAGVPRDNIERAIARATGEGGKDSSAHVVYEAMVVGNTGVIIECLTDNTTRTIHKLRETLNEYNGRFTPVKFLFDKVGRVQVSVPDTDDRDGRIEAILEAASAAGGEDFEVLEETDLVEYYCPPESLEAMTKAISELTGGEDIVSSENIFRAKDAPGEVEESLGEDISELKEALLEGEGDCVRVWTTIDSRIRTIDGE